MNTISEYSLAAVLLVIKLFTLSMYVPVDGENPVITAVIFTIMSLIKLCTLIPLFYCAKKQGGYAALSGRFKAFGCIFFALGAAGLAAAVSDLLSTAIESVYPDRYTKFSITLIFFFICAYIASMGIKGFSRCSAGALFVILPLMLFVFYQMRGALLNDRLNFYADRPLPLINQTVKNLLEYTVDYFIFFGLLPYLKGSPSRAAGIYICADIIIVLLVLLTSASVMGSFWDNSGYIFFALSFSTFGSVIDRSDGIYLAISSGAAIICGSALLIVLKDSLNFFNGAKDKNILLISAAALTAICVFADNLQLSSQRLITPICLFSAAVLFIISCISAVRIKRIDVMKNERTAQS